LKLVLCRTHRKGHDAGKVWHVDGNVLGVYLGHPSKDYSSSDLGSYMKFKTYSVQLGESVLTEVAMDEQRSQKGISKKQHERP